MNARQVAIGAGAVALLLTGCGASDGATTKAAAPGQSMAGMTMAPGESMAGMTMAPGESMAGMTMAPGQSMAGMTMAPGQSMAGGPSKAAAMVCSDDIRDQVRTVLRLSKPAPVRSSWQDQLYTCSYTLPMGQMVLSVKQSAGKPAAQAYFESTRRSLGRTESLAGLGEQAYGTGTGIVVVRKDDMTLRVDTTGLPVVFGELRQRRTDLAYEIASDVLGCWTGDGDE